MPTGVTQGPAGAECVVGEARLPDRDLPSLARLLHRSQRKLEHLRSRLASARANAAAHEAEARANLQRMQDLQAHVFRLQDRAAEARREADEASSRLLDLEAGLRAEQARFATLQAQATEVGDHLRQALATHAADNATWTAEMERLRTLHVDEVARLRTLHAEEVASWRAENEQLRERLKRRSLSHLVRAPLQLLGGLGEKPGSNRQAAPQQASDPTDSPRRHDD